MRKVTRAAFHRAPWALGLFALLCGCSASLVLHVSLVSFDSQLKLFLGGGGNSSVLLHGRSQALMVDTKTDDTSLRLRHSVEQELLRTVQRIVLTHAHSDHADGLSLYPDVGVVLVHPNTRKRLEAKGIHAPWVEVEREVRIFLDGEEVRVLSLGSGHTDGDLVALLPGRRLLVAGDLINDGIEPYCDVSYGGDILTMAHTLPRLMTLEFEQVVPGHGELMSRAQAQRVSDFLAALEAAVRRARATGATEDQVAAQVSLPEYPYQGTLFVASREGNVRAMFRALERDAHRAPGQQ